MIGSILNSNSTCNPTTLPCPAFGVPAIRLHVHKRPRNTRCDAHRQSLDPRPLAITCAPGCLSTSRFSAHSAFRGVGNTLILVIRAWRKG